MFVYLYKNHLMVLIFHQHFICPCENNSPEKSLELDSVKQPTCDLLAFRLIIKIYALKWSHRHKITKSLIKQNNKHRVTLKKY